MFLPPWMNVRQRFRALLKIKPNTRENRGSASLQSLLKRRDLFLSNPFSSGAAVLDTRGRLRPSIRSGRLTPYLLLAPATILFAIFMFYPLLYTLYLSFFDWNMTRPTKEFVALIITSLSLPTPISGKSWATRHCISCCCSSLTLQRPTYSPSFCLSWSRRGKLL